MPTNSDVLIKAVQVATRKLASSGRINKLLEEVLSICVDAVGAEGGTIYLHEPHSNRLRFQHVLPETVLHLLPRLDIPDDYGMAGEAFQSRKTLMKDFPEKQDEDRNEFEKSTNMVITSMMATPLMLENEEPIGIVQLLNKKAGHFTENDIAVLDIIASVSTLAFLNFRLNEESTRASTLLGMGKVSHDIGNLAASLYANISFTDMALQDLESHAKKSKNTELSASLEMLAPMHEELKSSVDRIVGYSRLVSDMSAGRKLRPELSAPDILRTIKSASSYLESDARSKQVKLICNFPASADEILHDELYVFRIVQNLVGNAIKAVHETTSDEWLAEHENDESAFCGEVTISYLSESGQYLLKVADTGPGMNEEVKERLLSGNAKSQWDKGAGSGWGMKIVMELASALNAKVSIESELGQGATFVIDFEPSDSKLPSGRDMKETANR